MGKNQFTYEHSSGRFDRSVASVRADLRAWEKDDSISLMSFTEFNLNPRRNALKAAGWSLYNGTEKAGADDCVIRWRKDTWTLLHRESAVVSRKKSWRTNGRLIPPQHVTSVLLKHKPTGNTLLVSVAHLPSHVEVRGGLRDSHRTEVWRDSTTSWKRHIVSLRSHWHPTASIVTADWNVNLRASWFRAFLGNLFPGMRPVWSRPYPKRGTDGKRIIDVPLITQRLGVARCPVLLQHKSSDHTAFRVVLKWKAKP